MTKIPFLDLSAQYRQIENEVLPMLTEAMRNAMFIGGPNVEGFENDFATFCDAQYCIGVNSGTDALRFALIACGIGAGDEVITVPNTFIATTEAITQAGAVPVFVDIDPDTCNMDARQVEGRITKQTKAIIPVHLYGQPADIDPIAAIADEHALVVIEDAAQAHGAAYKNRKAGSLGKAGCFSFYPGKNLGAFGEGGAVVTDDAKISEKIKMIRDHGQGQKYFHEIEGYNGRLDAIQAGVLKIKLKHLPEWNRSRQKNAALYHELLAPIANVDIVKEADFAKSVYHLLVIMVDDRDHLQNFLNEKGIATGLHYPLPLHLQKAYHYLGYKEGDFPVAERSAKRLLSLPMYPELTMNQIEYIVSCIKEFMATKINKN